MKRLWFIAIFAATATACVEGNNPVQLIQAFPLNESCEKGASPLIRGKLNFNASTSYEIGFTLFSPLASETSDTSPAGFYAEEVVLSYEARNPKVSLSDESEPIFAVVEAGAQPDSAFLRVNLIGTEARKKLDSAVPSAPLSMTLLTTVKLKGKLASGKSVETNEVTFPIDISRGTACPAGFEPTTPPADAQCKFAGQDSNFDLLYCKQVTGG